MMPWGLTGKGGTHFGEIQKIQMYCNCVGVPLVGLSQGDLVGFCPSYYYFWLAGVNGRERFGA